MLHNSKRLEKGKINVVNLSRGGAKIKHVEGELDNFYKSHGSDFEVKKLFLCVGTNDIRYCFDNGVRHLKAPLKRLIAKIKTYHINAKIYIQPILPQDVVRRSTRFNILEYNKILHDLCSSERLYYLNVFSEFLDMHGFKNKSLFEKRGLSVHPNVLGMGRLARHYINVIHEKRFNPLVY